MKRRGKREIPEKTRRLTASSGTIPTCENPVTRPGIEPGLSWWEASRLTTQLPWPLIGKLTKQITTLLSGDLPVTNVAQCIAVCGRLWPNVEDKGEWEHRPTALAEWSGEIWMVLNMELSRADEGEARCRDARAEETGDPREQYPPTCDIVRPDSPLRQSGSAESLRWQTSSLATTPPRAQRYGCHCRTAYKGLTSYLVLNLPILRQRHGGAQFTYQRLGVSTTGESPTNSQRVGKYLRFISGHIEAIFDFSRRLTSIEREFCRSLLVRHALYDSEPEVNLHWSNQRIPYYLSMAAIHPFPFLLPRAVVTSSNQQLAADCSARRQQQHPRDKSSVSETRSDNQRAQTCVTRNEACLAIWRKPGRPTDLPLQLGPLLCWSLSSHEPPPPVGENTFCANNAAFCNGGGVNYVLRTANFLFAHTCRALAVAHGYVGERNDTQGRRMCADGTPTFLDVFLAQCLDDKDLVRRVSSRYIWPVFSNNRPCLEEFPARLPQWRSGLNPRPGHSGFSHVGIVSDDAFSRRVFSGISRFPSPFIPELLHTHPITLIGSMLELSKSFHFISLNPFRSNLKKIFKTQERMQYHTGSGPMAEDRLAHSILEFSLRTQNTRNLHVSTSKESCRKYSLRPNNGLGSTYTSERERQNDLQSTDHSQLADGQTNLQALPPTRHGPTSAKIPSPKTAARCRSGNSLDSQPGGPEFDSRSGPP
ncbi:hypothetical protein PR048_022971 [Dryococelus australis]|uniref:Uncharacterized protein n=1 Tax=Dryococelus australis TaxID=614101 RepID=A0ABQ9GSR4_9NEOP|nr:hypothetical protein PR048_022971 [Dryococelus australis]